MRKLLCILAGLMLAACVADAETLFYKGLMRVRRSGDGIDSRQTLRAWLIVDRASGTAGRINYYPAGGFYSVEANMAFTTNLVRLPEQKSATVLAVAGQDAERGPAWVYATFLRGNNARLQVARTNHATFPRVFDWNSRSIGPVGEPPATEILEETGTLTFDGATTIASNNKPESFADAKARVVKQLESLGYREIVVK